MRCQGRFDGSKGYGIAWRALQAFDGFLAIQIKVSAHRVFQNPQRCDKCQKKLLVRNLSSR